MIKRLVLVVLLVLFGCAEQETDFDMANGRSGSVTLDARLQSSGGLRITESSFTSAQSVTVTWQGFAQKSGTSEPVVQSIPVIVITAGTDRATIVYVFDAIPGGNFCLVADRVTVDLQWRNSQIYVPGSGTVKNEFSGAPVVAPSGSYTVSAVIREGATQNAATYTQFYPFGVVAETYITKVPFWATSAAAWNNGGWVVTNSIIAWYLCADPQNSYLGPQLAAIGQAQLDTLQAYGGQLPIQGAWVEIVNGFGAGCSIQFFT